MSAMGDKPLSIAVIGLGNVLLGDDGFGPFVIELLRRRYDFAPQVELLDLGTPGLGLITHLYGLDAVVIVDAVAGVGNPGEVRVWEGDELMQMGSVPRVSPHDPAVAEALCVARAAGDRPLDACLVTTVPGSLDLGAALSEVARAAADVAVDIIRRRVEDCGFEVRPRDAGLIEIDWWLRS